MQKTFRTNLVYGGTLFVPRWRTKKINKIRILTLCDVSQSVGKISRFLLMFLYSLSEVFPEMRSFAFSDHLGEVSEHFHHSSIEEAIEQTLQIHGGGLTHYGQVLEEFQTSTWNEINHRTLILLLGDGRNNGLEPRFDLVKALQDRCKQLIWVNPEHPYQWSTGDSEMLNYSRYCHQTIVCNTLQHLEQLIQYLLRISR